MRSASQKPCWNQPHTHLLSLKFATYTHYAYHDPNTSSYIKYTQHSMPPTKMPVCCCSSCFLACLERICDTNFLPSSYAMNCKAPCDTCETRTECPSSPNSYNRAGHSYSYLTSHQLNKPNKPANNRAAMITRRRLGPRPLYRLFQPSSLMMLLTASADHDQKSFFVNKKKANNSSTNGKKTRNQKPLGPLPMHSHWSNKDAQFTCEP